MELFALSNLNTSTLVIQMSSELRYNYQGRIFLLRRGVSLFAYIFSSSVNSRLEPSGKLTNLKALPLLHLSRGPSFSKVTFHPFSGLLLLYLWWNTSPAIWGSSQQFGQGNKKQCKAAISHYFVIYYQVKMIMKLRCLVHWVLYSSNVQSGKWFPLTPLVPFCDSIQSDHVESCNQKTDTTFNFINHLYNQHLEK